jgi:putative CocE/NonD family hydrolase
MVEDQRFAFYRPDVLAFTSEPLENPVTVAGKIFAKLYASVSSTDADFVVKLIDVYPDSSVNKNGVEYGGFQQLVRYDIMRGKFRNSYSSPQPFIPDKPELVVVPLQDVLHTFKKGHKIMVQIQSSMFPFFDRNPQIFTDIYSAKDSDFRKAKITIFTGKDFPSQLKVNILQQKRGNK